MDEREIIRKHHQEMGRKSQEISPRSKEELARAGKISHQKNPRPKEHYQMIQKLSAEARRKNKL